MRNSSTPVAPWRFDSFFPSCAVHVRDVRVHRQLRADRADDVDLLRRVRDVILGADHVRDPVPHVFHRRGEVVRRPSVAAHEHDVLELLVRELDVAAHDVLPRRHALVRHAEADRALVLVRLAVGDELLGDARGSRRAGRAGTSTSPSQSSPSQRSDSWICSTASATSRLVSVFSIRSRNSPPWWRAKSQLKRNVRTPPMWRKPGRARAIRRLRTVSDPPRRSCRQEYASYVGRVSADGVRASPDAEGAEPRDARAAAAPRTAAASVCSPPSSGSSACRRSGRPRRTSGSGRGSTASGARRSSARSCAATS